ncbi:hypothetical protein [Streptomyces sp. NPDC089795]|uniref:hypothetical protein n=1 Tax=Streptomyces sp. NPDC089795 TaxID=3155297 RepID=UPI00341EA4FF
MTKFACSSYTPATEEDTRWFLAVPDAVESVRQMLQFPAGTQVEIIVEAVCTNSSGRKVLVMAGPPPIEDDEDNREGYVWLQGSGDSWVITDTQAIVLPMLS